MVILCFCGGKGIIFLLLMRMCLLLILVSLVM